jgi:hypothetical protein
LLDQIGVKVVYAESEDECKLNDSKVGSMSNAEADRVFGRIKGRAIARELQEFYSKYEGQTWKNIVSVGDSTFERLGTHIAVHEYRQSMGLNTRETNFWGESEVNGHIFKVRTKTCKLMECPSIDEITAQIHVLQQWLPAMVRRDGSFDVQLCSLAHEQSSKDVEEALLGCGTPPAARAPPTATTTAWP